MLQNSRLLMSELWLSDNGSFGFSHTNIFDKKKTVWATVDFEVVLVITEEYTTQVQRCFTIYSQTSFIPTA